MKNEKQHYKATAEQSTRNVMNVAKTNCLAITHPSIASEWHPTLNKDLSPYCVTYGSNKKVWWICKKRHEWAARIADRTLHEDGCPYCSGRRPIAGETDLATLSPEIAKEWNYDRNHGKTPQMYTKASGAKVWWRCANGHEWAARIINRTLHESGCPYCSGNQPIVGETDLVTLAPEVSKEWNHDRNHGKTPQMFTKSSGQKVWWRCANGHEWAARIINRTLHESGCPYCSGNQPIVGETDLATLAPEVAKEWNYERNLDKTPQMYTKASGQKVWWRCANGHEWAARIGKRIMREHGCPYCSGRLPIVGETDLATLAPEVAKEWNYEKNHGKTPQMFTKSSSQKVWWRCIKGHEWAARIADRHEQGCPYCSGRLPIVGETDLATLSPEIAKEWNYEKNHGKTPQMFTKSSGQKVWWRCIKGHEWAATIASRTGLETGCPYCSGTLPIVGETDLATLAPEVAKEWNYEKNHGKTPQMFTKSSSQKVWWRCIKGHEWAATIADRHEQGCPYCSGRLPIVGETDLATLSPEIAKEWNYERNHGKTPQMFTKSSGQKVWWRCIKGHEWAARIGKRTMSGQGCPYCSGARPTVGETDLATLVPEISEEWNYEKNHGKTPQMFTKSSSKKVWWRCTNGHEWRQSIVTRTSYGTTCPQCARSL